MVETGRGDRSGAPAAATSIHVSASPALLKQWATQPLGLGYGVLAFRADGWGTCQYEAASTPAQIRMLMALGSQVIVLAPFPLRVFIENEVRMLTDGYIDTRSDAQTWTQWLAAYEAAQIMSGAQS